MLPRKLHYNMEMYIIQIVSKSKINIKKNPKYPKIKMYKTKSKKILEKISYEYEKP